MCASFNERTNKDTQKMKERVKRSARGIMVIVVGNGHGDTSSNPGQD